MGSIGSLISTLPNEIWEVIEDAGKEIFSWLGLEGSYETLTDIQITNLLTPGEADKGARNSAIRSSGGDSMIYSQAYKAFQRDYKLRYNERWLSNLGYLPTSTATTKVLQEDLVLAHLQVSDPLATSILQMAIRYMTAEEVAYDWMEDNVGYSNLTGISNYLGKTWINLVVTDTGANILMDFIQDPTENIIDDLTNNYSYDDINDTVTTIATAPNTYELSGTSGLDIVQIRYTVDDGIGETFAVTPETAWTRDTAALEPGTYSIDIYETDSLDVETLTDTYDIIVVGVDELWDVPVFDLTDLGGYYRTTVTSQYDLSTLNIDTAINTIQHSIAGTLDDNQKLWLRYTRGGAEWYYYSQDYSTVPVELYESANIAVTSIITMKEDNVIVPGDNKNLKRMLNKLGLSPETFTSSLANQDLDSAYLMTGISANTQTHAGKKMVFNMFDLISEGSGDLSISIDRLKMTYSFTLTKSAVNANVMPVGEYSNDLEVSGSTYRRRFRYQATETQYLELLVENFLLTYQISGQNLSATFANGDDDLRLILPMDLFNNLRYREWVEIYESSLSMLSYSTQEVYMAWYESSAFSIIMKIVAVVMTVIAIFFPPAWAVSAAAWAAATVGYVFTLTTFYIAIAVIIIGAGLLINEALTILVDELGLSPALANLLLVAASIAMSDMSNISFGAEQWLPLATSITNGVSKVLNAYYQDKTEDLLKAEEADIEKFKSENDTIISMLENMRSMDSGAMVFDMNIATRPVNGAKIERMYSLAKGDGQYEINEMFQSSIPSLIENKINVVVGR